MAEEDQAAARFCAEVSEADPRFRGKFLFQIPRNQWVSEFFDAEDGARSRATRLRAVVDEYGWPGIDLVGEDGAAAAWILLQHAEPSLQRWCLPMLAQAVQAGQADAEHLAAVTDRIELQEGRPQVYGTHLCVSTDGGREPVHGVVNPQGLDERRGVLGLLPWSEYVASLSQG